MALFELGKTTFRGRENAHSPVITTALSRTGRSQPAPGVLAVARNGTWHCAAHHRRGGGRLERCLRAGLVGLIFAPAKILPQPAGVAPHFASYGARSP